MRQTINIGGHEVAMAANAASPFLYRKLFGEDFIAKLYADGNEVKDQINLITRMAYVMMMQAKAETGEIDRQTLYGMNMDGFYEWLEGIDDPMALHHASSDIVGLYFKTTNTTSKAKKAQGAGRSARTRQASTSSAVQS